MFEDISSSTSFYKSIMVNEEEMPSIKEADVALIGLTENRGTSENQGVEHGANVVRSKLYNLKKGAGSYKIIDLGNLRNGVDLSETHLRIKEVCQFLMENNVLPVLVGGSQDLDYGQYMAYEALDKLVTVLNVDAFLDMEDSKESDMNQSHLQSILLHDPNFLFNYSHLAYQSYLINPQSIAVLEKLYFDSYRVGHLRSHLAEMEPIVRDADMLTFDVTAIRSSDAPGNFRAQPFGLTGEEACQLSWYAGLNEKLSSFGVYEYNPDLDDKDNKTASVAATMIWYFIEGYYSRKNEQDFKTNDYLKFVVAMPSEPETLNFYKSKLSEKWWMEVPFPEGKTQYARNCIIPCNYSDYEKATQGDLPDRYISTHAKLI